MLLLVFSAGALAEDKTQLTASQREAVSQVKSQAMKERQYLMNECKRIVTQVAGLQESVKSIEGDKGKALAAQIDDLQSTAKALQAQLLKAPRYFDDPLADPLRP
jgi:uncharacterized protein (DUF3084 family)